MEGQEAEPAGGESRALPHIQVCRETEEVGLPQAETPSSREN